MRLKGKFRCVGASDTGRVREHNEDTIGTDGDIGLVVLADGMGGYKAGEVASGIAVRTVLALIKDAVDREDLSLRDDANDLSRPGILLRDAIQRAKPHVSTDLARRIAADASPAWVREALHLPAPAPRKTRHAA